jgi:hypothetical protein
MAKGSILNVLEKQLAHLLKCRLLPEKAYLAGGITVYFYLNHRVSIDLVFFEDAENEVDNIMMINANKKIEKLEKKEWQKIKTFFKGFIR